jgi:lipoprotein
MKNKIPFLLLTLLSFVVGCTQYPPFEKNNWGKQELHGKVKTLKSTVYDYNYDDDGVLEEIDTIVEICHFNEKGFYTEVISEDGKSIYSYPKEGIMRRFFISNDSIPDTISYKYSYNKKGDLEVVEKLRSNMSYSYEYTYDNKNRVTEEVLQGIILPREKKLYQYDHNGNIKNEKQYEWRLFGKDEWKFTTEWRCTYNNKRHKVTQELHETKRDTLKHSATFRYEYIYDKQGNYLQSKRFLRLIRTGKEVLSEIEKREITYY